MKHLVPEQPVRVGLFRAKELARAPAVGHVDALLRRMSYWAFDKDDAVSEALVQMGWERHASLGLALCDSLDPEALPSEPGVAWRIVGRRMREALQAGGAQASSFFALLESFGKEVASRNCVAFLVRHRRKTWFHPQTEITLEELVDSGQWESADLGALLKSWNLCGWHEGGRRLKVHSLPTVPLAMLKRRGRAQLNEEDVLNAVAKKLDCEPTWAAVTSATRQATWRREKRTKSDGGFRRLHVPDDRLLAAQRIISEILLNVTPKRGSATAFHAGASPALHARAHAGAVAAVRLDLANFFGSVRRWHLEPWLGLRESSMDEQLLPSWSRNGRLSLLSLLFFSEEGRTFLPQGAPSSPAAANLAGMWLDRVIVARAVKVFGAGSFVYTRYADDLVLSTTDGHKLGEFLRLARTTIVNAVRSLRWRVRHAKSRTWTHTDGKPLVLCGIRVPRHAGEPLSLGHQHWRRGRAALHRMRHRVDFSVGAPDSPTTPHGLLAYCYSATADLRWLAYTSRQVQTIARYLAGPLFSEAVLAGWSDRTLGPPRGAG